MAAAIRTKSTMVVRCTRVRPTPSPPPRPQRTRALTACHFMQRSVALGAEVDRMFSALEAEYPQIRTFWKSGYVRSVMGMPSRSNAGEPRSFGYAKGKLVKVLEYRREALVPLTMDSMRPVDLEAGVSKWIYMKGFDQAAAAKGLRVPILYVHSSEIPWSSLDPERLVDITVFWMKSAFEEFGCDQFSAVLYGPDLSMSIMWYASSYIKSLSSRFVQGFPDRLYSLYSCPTYRLNLALYEVAKLVLPTPVVNKLHMIGSGEEAAMAALTSLTGTDEVPTFYGGPSDHSEYRTLGLEAQMALTFGETKE